MSVGDLEVEQQDLFRRERVGLTRLAYLLTGSVEVAEELVQDAFEQVVRRWNEVREPAGYLRVAVVNGARSWGRRQSVRQRSPKGRLEHEAALDPDTLAVRAALATLSMAEREVIVLRYYAGLTQPEIAAAINRPVGTVKSLIFRSLRKLEEELK